MEGNKQMPKYDVLPIIETEIDQLNCLLKRYGSIADLNRLKQSKSDLERQHRQLTDELKLIKADNSQIYQMIYYHDVKRKDWYTVCEMVYPGEYHPDPGDYCRKKIARYLKNKY